MSWSHIMAAGDRSQVSERLFTRVRARSRKKALSQSIKIVKKKEKKKTYQEKLKGIKDQPFLFLLPCLSRLLKYHTASADFQQWLVCYLLHVCKHQLLVSRSFFFYFSICRMSEEVISRLWIFFSRCGVMQKSSSLERFQWVSVLRNRSFSLWQKQKANAASCPKKKHRRRPRRRSGHELNCW